MKRIIDGRRYDTGTAELVAHHDNHLGRRDFRWESTGLYRTTRGAWFLAGEGGCQSRWSTTGQDGRSWYPGEGVRPLADHEARAWLEAHGLVDEIEEHFADQVQDA